MTLPFGRSALAAVTLAALSTPALADDHVDPRQPMSALDLVSAPRVGSPVVGKDGDRYVYQVTTTDRDTLKRTTTTYTSRLSAPKLPHGKLDLGGDAYDLKFGDDGYLYFLSSRAPTDGASEQSRLWRVMVDGGTVAGSPQLVLDAKASIAGYALAPGAKRVAVWGDIARDCATFGCDGDGTAHLPGPGTGRLYDGSQGFVRHWDDWETTGTYSRIFVFDLANGKASASGTALDSLGRATLTGDSPTKPFGGGEEIAWSADGSTVFFTARNSDAAEPRSTDTDIYAADLTRARLTDLTAANEATDTQPAPSPDGKWLAYLAMKRPGYESDRLVVQLRDLKTGRTRALTEGFDRSFGSLAWTDDSRYIIATAQDVLDTPAFRIDVRSGAVERLDLMAGNEAHIGNVQPLSNQRLLFTRDSIGAPPEIYLSAGYEQAQPLTAYGKTALGERSAVVTDRFSFTGAGGDTVWGQITKPEGYEGKLPAILYVHGGPQGSFNDGWSSRWNPRVVASQGYAVVSVDFHGSTGYGQAFTDSINRDWGGKPLQDLQLGLAAALAQDSQIDGERTCAMGASYGGYMMNWIAGRWPDRFKCLVQHDGLFDMRSFYYTTEELWFPAWDFGGSYTEARDEYERWNPVNYVENWQTPMLVITGEKDFRVPYTQGIASFTALQERDIPSELLVFPDENHWVLKPANSLQWHNTVFAWLDRWLKDDAEGQ